MSFFLLRADITYKLDGSYVNDHIIYIENEKSLVESTLLENTTDPVDLLITNTNGQITPTHDNIIFREELSFHLSFFERFFDFSRHQDMYAVPGSYTKAGKLAIFTHVFNEDATLKIWEKYYSGIVPARDLYVIDHGSTSSPKEVLSPEVKVVSIPRGPMDHRAISQFCNTFQRFLLSQYRWVIHIDADEILLHAKGWDYLMHSLLNREDGVCIKAAHGVNLVHDMALEPALDLSAPISLQRHRLVAHPDYRKPVISSVPVTWREGFHTVFEAHSVIEDDDLWLVHLSYADLDSHIEKRERWANFAVEEAEKKLREVLYQAPERERIRRLFTSMLETSPAIAVPDWMRGLF